MAVTIQTVAVSVTTTAAMTVPVALPASVTVPVTTTTTVTMPVFCNDANYKGKRKQKNLFEGKLYRGIGRDL